MKENSRNHNTNDRQFDHPKESNPHKRNDRQNASRSERENDESLERGSDRRDSFATAVPDNYERDSE
jgi:hypothetical protein